MKEILVQMFNGWILHNQSWDNNKSVYTRDGTDCMIEAAGGDVARGRMIALFDHWSNDIESLAPHFGVAVATDVNGKLYVREDIPPAPSPEHWWIDGRWQEPPTEDGGKAA